MGQIARWERGGGKQPVRATLVIEIEPVTKLTLPQRVAQVEKQFNGKILDARALLAGMPAVRMKFPGSASLPRHEVLVAKHESRIYMLELHATADAWNPDDAWKTLTSGWKWISVEAPVGHLQLAAQPISLFNGLMRFRAPEVMRLFPNGAQTHASLAVVDNRTDVMALVVEAQVLPNPNHLSLSQLEDSFTDQVKKILKLDTAIVWKERAGKPSLFLTNTLEAHLTSPGGPPAQSYATWVRYGLAPIDKDRLLLLAFTVTAPTEEERKAYEATVDQMLDSLAIDASRAAAPGGKTG